MVEINALYIIAALQKKWKAVIILSHLLISLAGGVIITSCCYKFGGHSVWWIVPFCGIVFFALLFFDRSWKIRDRDVVRFLNKKYPELEESAELLLIPISTLPFIQQLQAQKCERALDNLYKPSEFYKKLSFPFSVFLIAMVIGVGLLMIPYRQYQKVIAPTFSAPGGQLKAEKILPAISAVTVVIQPPAYTRKPARTGAHFNLEAEEGSNVNWRIKTNTPVKNVQFILNDLKALELKPVDKQHISWQINKTINTSGFYQVKIDTITSELYKIEMVKDQPPVISIQTPVANTVIDYGDPEKVTLNVLVKDDYGIRDVSVAATISSGSGEAVKFQQQQINFTGSFAAQLASYQLKKTIDLAGLGMKPGDELYFYIKATDNNQHEKRSDIFMVSITDTAQLMSSEGLVNGISVKPEYFRSERQIIIETEQLIKDKDKLSEEEFRNRSNNLGIDQKLLRLRYGKFLGEEAESNDEEHPTANNNDPKDFGNAEKILDAYTDKHDNAETADFFEPATKSQLKATLTEMWNAELQLRTFKPVAALPYEYKALRLLKDLQQKSRAYVAKTNLSTAPLKPESRLTADLSKVIQPSGQRNIEKNTATDETIGTAISVLEKLKDQPVLDNNSVSILQQASRQLAEKAIKEPSRYISSLNALKRIIVSAQNGLITSSADISLVENAFQKMIAAPYKLPSINKGPANANLSKAYFKNLNNTKPR